MKSNVIELHVDFESLLKSKPENNSKIVLGFNTTVYVKISPDKIVGEMRYLSGDQLEKAIEDTEDSGSDYYVFDVSGSGDNLDELVIYRNKRTHAIEGWYVDHNAK